MSIRYVGFLIEYLFLSGVWQGLYSRRDTKKTSVTTRLSYVLKIKTLGLIVNTITIGRAYMTTSIERRTFTLTSSYNFVCHKTLILDLEMTKSL